MEIHYSNTRVRSFESYLEVEQSDDGFETKRLTSIKLDCISHLTLEGPFGDYDRNDEPINVWLVNLYTSRYSSGKRINHTVVFSFFKEEEAESFLQIVNKRLY